MKLLFVIALIMVSGRSSSSATVPVGYWKGSIVFSTKPSLPFEFGLDIQKANTGYETFLDIRALLMNWEPISNEIVEGKISVVLPFGIGKFLLQMKGNSILSKNENFTLEAKRSHAFTYFKKILTGKISR